MPGYGHKTPRLCVALGFIMFFLLQERLSHSVSPLLEKVYVAIAFAADRKAPLTGKLSPRLSGCTWLSPPIHFSGFLPVKLLPTLPSGVEK